MQLDFLSGMSSGRQKRNVCYFRGWECGVTEDVDVHSLMFGTTRVVKDVSWRRRGGVDEYFEGGRSGRNGFILIFVCDEECGVVATI
jgi:hypothetical protein